MLVRSVLVLHNHDVQVRYKFGFHLHVIIVRMAIIHTTLWNTTPTKKTTRHIRQTKVLCPTSKWSLILIGVRARARTPATVLPIFGMHEMALRPE